KRPDDPRLGPFVFSVNGWQGHEGAERDQELESRIAAAVQYGSDGTDGTNGTNGTDENLKQT
ncbi:MAG TPA: hypothetical protein VFV54_10415, partial [Thermoanaerobaculia bacterium]|nr:hypothetical protein [Thermoanaerobaculia bacterium]